MGHPNIFPNLWVALTHQVCLRIPRGPLETELWWLTLLPKGMDEASRRSAIYGANHFFGPAGFLEQDDGENWHGCFETAGNPVIQKIPFSYEMGHGHEWKDENLRAKDVAKAASEVYQRSFYRRWYEQLTAETDEVELIARGA